MIPVDFTIDAKNDLFDAVCYYESKEVGLGVRLRDEILMMLDTAAHAPYLWRERSAGFRRINCPIFPYYIAYVIRDEVLVVIALAASRRRPGYWSPRLRQ